MRVNPFLILPLILLAACGGGGGGGGGSTNTPAPVANQALSGKVADGYISGAQVCLDLNSNGLCDGGEPATTTDSTGSYSLSFAGTVSLTTLNVLVNVPVGAVDSDLPSTPISAPFTLAAPAAAHTAGQLNINPLFTLVAAQLRADSTLTTTTATTRVLNLLGLPATLDPKADYLALASSSPALHNVNQLLATVLQNTTSGAPLTSTTLSAAVQAAAPYVNTAYLATTPAAVAAATQSAVEAAAAGQLVTAVSTFSYANADLATLAGNINSLRARLPVGLLSQTPTLDTASTSHAAYLQAQNFVGDHSENSSASGFTGATPAARAAAAAYPGSSVGEEIVLGASSGANCFAALENSTYHLAQLLAPFLNLGVAFNTQTNGSACVVTLGTRSASGGQFAPTGTVGVYPANGQTGVAPTYYNQFETPNPLPSQAGAGHAVVATLYSVGNSTGGATLAGTDVVVHTFSLKQGTTPVSLALLAAPGATSDGPVLTADSNLPGNGFVVAVPLSPLAPNTQYTASFSATVKGVNLSKTWSFTTGAQN